MNPVPLEMIVNFTPTGMIPTKAMTPHVPVHPDEIVAQVREAWEIGITVAHLHVRDNQGKPSLTPETYATIIGGIRSFAPDLIIAVSLSGRFEQDRNMRAAPLELTGSLKPDMGSLTLSSLNFNKMASVNDPETIMFLARRMMDKGIKAELEAFDVGMLNFATYLLQKGLLKGRQYVNLIIGNIASAQPTLLHLGTMVADLPEGTLWSFGGVGNCMAQMHAVAAAMGGGVRVGLEDNIWLDNGRTLLARNADLIRRVHTFAEMCERPIMAPAKLRNLLGLADGNGRYGVDPSRNKGGEQSRGIDAVTG